MKSADIRESYLKFFENHGHRRVKSSGLIPAADPTLLFTNAGMVQFKDNFLGLKDAGYSRATTCQKCVRAGGKHNDLENVGFTPRHHTFFEMLGNFSFGDYFKEEAIRFAWELLTQHWNLPKDRLRITVFESDDEAIQLWKAVGVPGEWIYRLGEKDNFWAMGDTGPCGPCTEIHYDWGPRPGCGDNPGNDTTGRFLEIWNLVFMQFNRDSSGKMEPLPRPSVDTGAGLERLSCVMQGVFSNYDTDLFQPIIQAIAKRVDRPYGKEESDSVSMRVIADHLRSGAFLIADGVIPSNEGRGYVLRRILRRAIRHGKKLGQEKPFLHELVCSVETVMGKVYPEIGRQRALIEETLWDEEERFHQTLHRGMGILDEAIASCKQSRNQQIAGDIAFKLYDTFGFPLDLIQTIATENALGVDEAEFEKQMAQQRQKSVWNKAESGAAQEQISKTLSEDKSPTRFLGYESLTSESKLLFLFSHDGKATEKLATGSNGFAVFDSTPFYAESGGQVGDNGLGTTVGCHFQINTTFKSGRHFVHAVEVKSGELRPNVTYQLNVDLRNRVRTAINHTSTHLMHAALRRVLGDRVKQAGSLVDPERLRFDFTFPRGLTQEELLQIETLVNETIQKGQDVTVAEMPYDDAVKSGALAFFDEKYGDKVRVVRVGGKDDAFSVELCGGTHLTNVSTAVFFKILSESSVASGVRRIEAVTEQGALNYLQQRASLADDVERALGSKDILGKVTQLQTEVRRLQKENEKLQFVAAQSAVAGDGGGGKLWEKKKDIQGIQLVAEKLAGVQPKVLRELVDQAKDKLGTRAVVALAVEAEGKVALCVGVSKDLAGKVHAGQLVQSMAKLLGGSGGGRPDFAQAGGSDASKIREAFQLLETELATVKN
jgi:alanyl-tRNA synthetase